MSIVYLDGKNFSFQMIRFGWIPEQVPSCFNAIKLADKIDIIIPLVFAGKTQMKKTYSPVQLSAYKNDIYRRILSLTNIEGYLRLIKVMAEGFEIINNSSESSNSQSPITYIHSYEGGGVEKINDVRIKDFLKSKSGFIVGIHSRIKISLGYKYRLDVDVANCYDTIYTHSITWAMVGKENAKSYLRTKTPVSIKSKYEFADKLDTLTRQLKNNETNGIVVGPFTSRIVSELIFAAIDTELRNAGLVFKRYVDDFKFYFRTEYQATESVGTIQRILNKYNLNLNSQKTEIKKFPYEMVSDFASDYKTAYKDEGVFGVLNKASILTNSGEKGAYKYALKFIRDKKLKDNESDLVLPILLNIMLLDPKYGQYISAYLVKNKKSFNESILEQVINTELGKSLELKRDQETLWFLFLLSQLKIHVCANNILLSLIYENDFIAIIALDLWKNHNKMIIRTRIEAGKINNAIKDIADLLKSENYFGQHWLLLYEVDFLKLINKNSYTPIAREGVFEELFKNYINFYNPKGI